MSYFQKISFDTIIDISTRCDILEFEKKNHTNRQNEIDRAYCSTIRLGLYFFVVQLLNFAKYRKLFICSHYTSNTNEK